MLCAGCGGVWEPDSISALGKQFQSAFGIQPPADVSEMKCRIVNVGDSSSRWFSFKCSKATFDRLVNQGFDVVERKILDAPWTGSKGPIDLIEPYQRNVNAPTWWPEVRNVQFEQFFYSLNKRKGENGYFFLVLDKTNNKVYAHSSVWR